MQKNPTCLVDVMNIKNKEVFNGFGHAHISTLASCPPAKEDPLTAQCTVLFLTVYDNWRSPSEILMCLHLQLRLHAGHLKCTKANFTVDKLQRVA